MDDENAIRQAVGQVLARNWDPPGTAAQFDGYVASVCGLLASGASDRQVATYLCGVETERLGFADSDWRMLVPLAGKLRRLYVRTAHPPTR